MGYLRAICGRLSEYYAISYTCVPVVTPVVAFCMQPVMYLTSPPLQHVSNHTAKKGKAGQHQYTHLQLEKEGVILETQGIPEHRLAGLFGLVHCDPYLFSHNMEKIAQYNSILAVIGSFF